MQVTETELPGVLIIAPRASTEARGGATIVSEKGRELAGRSQISSVQPPVYGS